ncbi:hypothetical protein CHS0354_025053 [Potamilus streckersoni]|uniref:Uncharacterized protein n=1 Tax=Potamilus streckersoni TaxID=2493646 RepID=A0AAE0WA30_9BIVA|nr:hypothetical protein CHS0354_025053 [Potamilus streckersoni]
MEGGGGDFLPCFMIVSMSWYGNSSTGIPNIHLSPGPQYPGQAQCLDCFISSQSSPGPQYPGQAQCFDCSISSQSRSTVSWISSVPWHSHFISVQVHNILDKLGVLTSISSQSRSTISWIRSVS